MLNFSGLTSLFFADMIIINIFRSTDRVKYVAFFVYRESG
jgi:hypothetical protein